MTPEQKWPDTIWVVRHGESAGNVAGDAAESASSPLIDIAQRDMDTPLSRLGEQQSRALGRWSGAMAAAEQPSVVLCSPYTRVQATTRIVLDTAGVDRGTITFQADERLREKEFGVLDRLRMVGIRQKYPELSEQRAHVGKFYFRPPGGESWCDVIAATQHTRTPSRAGADRRPPSDRKLLALSSRTNGRAADPRHRSPGGRTELCRDVVLVRSVEGPQWKAGGAPGELRGAT